MTPLPLTLSSFEKDASRRQPRRSDNRHRPFTVNLKTIQVHGGPYSNLAPPPRLTPGRVSRPRSAISVVSSARDPPTEGTGSRWKPLANVLSSGSPSPSHCLLTLRIRSGHPRRRRDCQLFRPFLDEDTWRFTAACTTVFRRRSPLFAIVVRSGPPDPEALTCTAGPSQKRLGIRRIRETPAQPFLATASIACCSPPD